MAKNQIKNHVRADESIDPRKLKEHPRNRNKHGKDQVERLAKLFKGHGLRHPIIVSKRSGFIVAGHCRKLAAIKAGLKEVPVVYQDFADEAEEIGFLHADNAIAVWAELDIDGINLDLDSMKLDFDFDLLGIKDFTRAEGSSAEVPPELYTKKIEGPIYTPKGTKPALSELFSQLKTHELRQRIAEAKIPADVQNFLDLAACRHIVFDYENIAEYYAHAPKEVQRLMEESALVIIDFKKAIDQGFVKMSNKIAEAYVE